MVYEIHSPCRRPPRSDVTIIKMADARAENNSGKQGSVDRSAENSTGDPQNFQDLTQYVQTLLQQMQDKFQTMSDQIVSRIDEMGNRIDELERNIADLMTQAGVEEGEK